MNNLVTSSELEKISSSRATFLIKSILIILFIIEFWLFLLVLALITIFTKFSWGLLFFWLVILGIIGYYIWEVRSIFLAKKVMLGAEYFMIGKNGIKLPRNSITKVGYVFPLIGIEYESQGIKKTVQFVPKNTVGVLFHKERRNELIKRLKAPNKS